MIIFASPVWAGSYAPPLRTFFADEDILAKKVAFFYTHEGGKGKTTELFKESLSDNHLLGYTDINTNKTAKEANWDTLLNWYKELDLDGK